MMVEHSRSIRKKFQMCKVMQHKPGCMLAWEKKDTLSESAVAFGPF